VLTFDDGPVSQFRYVTDTAGNQIIDPNTMLGILEEFFTKYPDFGRGGLFSLLPLAPFAWPNEDDQLQFVDQKIQWLIDHGYEIGNHTVDHIDLRQATDEEIKAQLAGAVDMVRSHAPQAQMEVISVPFGQYPQGGDTTLFEGFDYKGKHYGFKGALMVGAEPAPSPMHAEFDPMWIPRIRADDEQLDKWFTYAKDSPGIMYVSDGNPETVTIPKELDPALVGALKESNAHQKQIIRY
jgi:peptidoglycan/xylan/chitin deacetylase (PgdA/CDA1 family)